ncbi:MAG: polysaccharide lyase family 1 protein [Mangrovibacterium sp.]
MKQLKTLGILFLMMCSAATQAQQLAFPGAMGHGATTKGGRGGTVYHVTNLNDQGAGSLREAIEATGARTVVFNVAGTIELESMLTISNPYITIAGQTAPNGGICLKNFPLHITNAHDVVVRYLRVRPGIASGLIGSEIDGIEVRDSKNIIIDHCSISYTCDEALNTWHGTENVTVQHTLIARPLHHSVHEKGAHGFGASLGGKNCSYLFNCFSSAVARNPSIGGNHIESTINSDFSNNVIFNYQYRTCDGKPRSINLIGNYYKPGPATKEVVANRIVKVDNAKGYHFSSAWHVADNVIDGNKLVNKNNLQYGVEFDEGCNVENNILDQACPTVHTKHVSAKKAYRIVLNEVGASKPMRDAFDTKVIAEIEGKSAIVGNGIIDKAEEAGGWANLEGTQQAPIDTDGDGMPDVWEQKHKLNSNDAADGKALSKSGYTNLELYLNSL